MSGVGWFLAASAAVAGAVAISSCTGARPYADGGQRDDQRGMGDDQWDEGIGLNASVQLGWAQPDDCTRWHYGGGMPGQPLPTNWARHRLAYPRRQSDSVSALMTMPTMHPNFPCNTARWYFDPPADGGL